MATTEAIKIDALKLKFQQYDTVLKLHDAKIDANSTEISSLKQQKSDTTNLKESYKTFTDDYNRSKKDNCTKLETMQNTLMNQYSELCSRHTIEMSELHEKINKMSEELLQLKKALTF